MDSDDDNDGQHNSAGPAAHPSQKRRAQKAIFESWLVSTEGQSALKATDTASASTVAHEVADDNLSVQALMSKTGTDIIKSPRDYQLELFERAKQQNTIAVLDTGSGKTLIAVLLIRWIIDGELERREAGQTPRVSFFLVASVTLAFQQFSVLETNLDHPVVRVCGADGPDTWDGTRWKELFSANKVVVCTADVLHQCLSRSYISMSRINLLIFDEAHHTKKNHAYARIIKDFYLAETDNRPRVFGMTASPLDARSDVVQAAVELETLLDSKIATTLDMSLAQSVSRPQEIRLHYTPWSPLFAATTPLLQALSAYQHIKVFSKVLEYAHVVTKELGSWCADEYIRATISETQFRHFEARIQKTYFAGNQQTTIELDAQLSAVRSAIALVSGFDPSSISSGSAAGLSAKVAKLQEYLCAEFERPSSHRCICFVDQRHTARLLNSLFQQIGTEHMRCAFLIGSGSPQDVSDNNFTVRQQIMTLSKFRQGEINCLFATSVAEEGLDVPDCNLVVRFDMYKTMIQYVQSRGRAREKNSRFVHMIESGNPRHQQLAVDVVAEEQAMRRFCEALPEDRRLIGNQDTLEVLMDKEKMIKFYIEPSTGAKLTYGNCLAILANFVSAIPNETPDESLQPMYVVTARGSKFIAEVILPGSAPLRSKLGRVHGKKSLAKRSAAFEACIELRQKNYLDGCLVPTYQRRLPAMRSALLAADLHKKNQYTMRTKPEAWAIGRGTIPKELWIMAIDFPQGLQRPHQPLVLLTRTQMPRFPVFPIFLNDGRRSDVSISRSRTSLAATQSTLKLFSDFTFRVFGDVFSKRYEEDVPQLSYWLAPAAPSHARAAEEPPGQWLDWTTLREVSDNAEYPWTPEMHPDFMLDKFLVDKWDGSRKFVVTNIEPDLKPADPLPDGAVRNKRFNDSIFDATVSLYRNSRVKATWDPDQPVVRADMIHLRRNMLALPETREVDAQRAKSTVAFLCPEPLRISALSTAVVESSLAFPAIIHRVESVLIALEACRLVGLSCEPEMALAAMTKDCDNIEDDEAPEQINFRRGMGDNYERLEFIGDTFLKTATTISTFIQNPNDDEFEFHVKRMLLLCNKNLYVVGVDLKLHEYVRTMAFSRRLWYPEGLNLLDGKGAGKNLHAQVTHTLGQKTIADVSEALIGAAYMTYDRADQAWSEDIWESAIRAVTTLVRSDDHTMQSWGDYRRAYKIPAYQVEESTASQRDLAQKAELEHHYKFKYPRLLRSAFVHPSQPFSYERVPNYQRLEFLGDALLDMASITYLFHRFPDKDPQWLTEHKMAMVSNKFLGALCVNIGFHRHLRYTSSILEHQIRTYAAELSEAQQTAGDARDTWTTVSDPPKCLPDVVEAYVGAMFIDSDFNYGTVQAFFDQHVRWYFEDIGLYDTFANNHPCTALHTLLETTYGCREYRLMARDLPPSDGVGIERRSVIAAVVLHSQVVAHSTGKSARYARHRAATTALDLFRGLAPFQFRDRFGCDCHLRTTDEDGGISRAVDCST